MNAYGNTYCGNAYANPGGQGGYGVSAGGQSPWPCAPAQCTYQEGFNNGESVGVTIGSLLVVGLLGLGACVLMKKGCFSA